MNFLELNEEIGNGLRLEPLMESVGGRKRMFLEGVHAQSEVINGNNRMYPNRVLNESVDGYVRDYVSKSRSIGELNHPQHVKPNPERAALFIKSLVMEKNDAIGKSEVLDNVPCGQIVYCLNERGVRLGVSTRGMGLMTENRSTNKSTVTRYRMSAIDAVLDPSAPDAVPHAIMESAEWMASEGNEQAKFMLDEMVKAAKLDSDDRIAAFAAFVSRLAAT